MRNGLPMREAVAFWSSYGAFDCTVSRRTACKRPAWSARMSRSRCAFLSRTTSGASDGALINSRTAWQPRRVASSAHRKARLKEPGSSSDPESAVARATSCPSCLCPSWLSWPAPSWQQPSLPPSWPPFWPPFSLPSWPSLRLSSGLPSWQQPSLPPSWPPF